ncbi:MAG: hypothetical protein ACOCSF_02450 [Halanaeroarchaeum sp.]
MKYYRCSDGETYSERDVWERMEAGVWRPCCWDTASGTEWMEAAEGRLLHLVPIDEVKGDTDHRFGRIQG